MNGFCMSIDTSVQLQLIQVVCNWYIQAQLSCRNRLRGVGFGCAVDPTNLFLDAIPPFSLQYQTLSFQPFTCGKFEFHVSQLDTSSTYSEFTNHEADQLLMETVSWAPPLVWYFNVQPSKYCLGHACPIAFHLQWTINTLFHMQLIHHSANHYCLLHQIPLTSTIDHFLFRAR